eukprot:09754_1
MTMVLIQLRRARFVHFPLIRCSGSDARLIFRGELHQPVLCRCSGAVHDYRLIFCLIACVTLMLRETVPVRWPGAMFRFGW